MHKLDANLGSPGARIHGADPQSIMALALGVVVVGMSGAMFLLLYLPIR